MNLPLATAIGDAADQTPSYDVLDERATPGRRRRRLAAFGSAVALTAVLALVGVALAPLVGHDRPTQPSQEPSGPALPDRIGSAAIFTDRLTDSPPGPASVIFTERSGLLTGDRLVTVGASDDTYRVIDAADADPGRTALLSPGGDRIAYPGGDGITVADLHTGKLRTSRFPEAGADLVRPVVWLPDGRGLVVLTITYAKHPTTEGIMRRLGVLDLDTNAYRDVAAGTWPVAPAGFTAAVSPDGGRIAYQYSDFITVYDRPTGAKHKLALPDTRTVLAGRGAWTPDGRSLAVVHRDTDDYPARRWYLRLLDPDTGVERDPGYRPALSGVALMRLLGWNGATGGPVVVGYVADSAPDGELGHGINVMTPELVREVGVYELDATGFRTLLAPADGITGLDVADVVVAGGLTRSGHPPQSITSAGWVAIGLAGTLFVVLAAIWLRRRRRHLKVRTQ